MSTSPHLANTDLGLLCDQLAGLLETEMPLGASLEALARDAKQGRLRDSLEALSAGVASGRSLDDCLRDQQGRFPPLLPALILSGERSGRLADSLRFAALHFWRLAELGAQVRNLLIYPLLILVLGIVVVVWAAFETWPIYQGTLDELGVSMPESWYLIQAIVEHPWFSGGIVAGGLVLLWLAWRFFSKRSLGLHMQRWVLYRFPLSAAYLKAAFVNRFSRSLALFLRSGSGLPEALGVVATLDEGRCLPGDLRALERSCRDGSQLSDAIEQHLPFFPQLGLGLLRSGERGGNLPDALEEIARASDVIAQRELYLLQTLVPPLTLAVVGLALFFLMRQLLLPIWSVVTSL